MLSQENYWTGRRVGHGELLLFNTPKQFKENRLPMDYHTWSYSIPEWNQTGLRPVGHDTTPSKRSDVSVEQCPQKWLTYMYIIYIYIMYGPPGCPGFDPQPYQKLHS